MTTVARQLSASEIELNKFLESEQCEIPDKRLLNKRKNALVLIHSDDISNSRESSCTLNEGQNRDADAGKSARTSGTEVENVQDDQEPMLNRSITDDSAIVVGSESVPKASSVSENPGSFSSRRINATIEQTNRNMATHSGG